MASPNCENKYITLLDLARQSKIITGDTACFAGKIQAGLPFSGYPTGVDIETMGSLGVIHWPSSGSTAVFSSNTVTTVFDVANPLSPFFPTFSGITGTSWTNPIFSAHTSGLTLPITLFSADTQEVGPFWFPSETGMTGEHIINTQVTGYTLIYSFENLSSPQSGPPLDPYVIFSGITSVVIQGWSAGTLDYKGPIDYLRSREDGTIDNKLTTKKLRVTGGALASTIGHVLTQIDELGNAGWRPDSGASADTNTFVVSGDLDGDTLTLTRNDLVAIPITGFSNTFTGNTSGECITDLFVTTIHGCSPVTFNSSIQHIGSSATGLNSIAWGSGNTTSDNFSSIIGGQFNSITGNSTGCENNTIVGGSNNTMSGFVSANSDNNTILGGLSNNITARSIRSTIIGGDSNIIGVSGGTTVNAVIVGGTGNVFPGLTSATNSVIVGGTGITGSSANTAYVPNLNIGTLGNGTPSYHLGIDFNGFVVTAATGGSSATCINELWVSTISGCSPVTIGPEVIIEESLTVGSGAQKWDNGYLGNDEFIALMPSDFMHREDGRGIPVDDAWISDSGGTMTVSAIGDFWVAMKIIPKGFECNGASVNTESLVTGGVSILYGDITTSTVTTILASQDTNTSIVFSPPVVGTGTEYIIIRYEPNVGLSPLRGGKIDIQRT